MHYRTISGHMAPAGPGPQTRLPGATSPSCAARSTRVACKWAMIGKNGLGVSPTASPLYCLP